MKAVLLTLYLYVIGWCIGTAMLDSAHRTSGLGQPECSGTAHLRRAHDKAAMAAARGIKDYWDYQLDHYIPLCLGGRDDESNLRFQQWPEAELKDGDEWRLCDAVCSGAMTQAAAVSELKRLWPEEREK